MKTAIHCFVMIFFMQTLISFKVTAQRKPDYPSARQVQQIDDYHGTRIVDPYRWMEEMESPDTRTWINQQEQLLETHLNGNQYRNRIKDRIQQIRSVATLGTPLLAGETLFYSETGFGENQPRILMRREKPGAPKVIFDPFLMLSEEERLSGFVVSPTGKHIILRIARGQSTWRIIRILEIDSGKLLPEKILGEQFGTSWRKDGTGFFYCRYRQPEDETAMTQKLLDPKIYYHQLGSEQTEDDFIFAIPEEPAWLLGPQVSTDGKYLLINVAKGSTFSGLVDQIYVKDISSPENPVTLLLPEADGQYAFEGNMGDRFWIRTSVAASNNRVIELHIGNPEKSAWKALIPESQEVLNSVSVIGNQLVTRYTRDAIPLIRIFRNDGRLIKEVELPAIALIGGLNNNPDSEQAFFSLWGLYETGSIYTLNASSGSIELFYRPETAHNPRDFVMQQVFYRSKDGTKVPMIIAHHKDTRPNPDSPLFMYAYGALAWSALPWYQPHIITWTELGGVYALPGIRGGGEYGDQWYRDGIGKNKQNGIDDFISAAKWLIENKYTSPEKLVANGGSASGMLAGAAIVQRPDLFGAAVIDIPRFDMLRYHLFTGGTARVAEIGSPDDPEMFPTIYAYSPYHNLRFGTCLPPVLVIAGEKDEIAPPLHAYKFIAALQATQDCNNPALLKIVRGAGHSYGTTPEQNAQTWADAWSFLQQTLDFIPNRLE